MSHLFVSNAASNYLEIAIYLIGLGIACALGYYVAPRVTAAPAPAQRITETLPPPAKATTTTPTTTAGSDKGNGGNVVNTGLSPRIPDGRRTFVTSASALFSRPTRTILTTLGTLMSLYTALFHSPVYWALAILLAYLTVDFVACSREERKYAMLCELQEEMKTTPQKAREAFLKDYDEWREQGEGFKRRWDWTANMPPQDAQAAQGGDGGGAPAQNGGGGGQALPFARWQFSWHP